MRERQRSKSGLFLIELMISILFFAITSAVFLQAFVKSHDVSRQAGDLFQGQKLASSLAEILEGSDDFSADAAKYFPHAQTEENGVEIGYDKDWEPAAQKEAVYALTARWQEEKGMWQVHISVCRKKEKSGKQQIRGQEKAEIYGLDLQIYRPGGRGGS